MSDTIVQKIIADIPVIIATAQKVESAIKVVQGNAVLSALLEKVWPGIATAEASFTSAVDFLSGLEPEVLSVLNAMFAPPKPSA
jgi:hypothetical protein